MVTNDPGEFVRFYAEPGGEIVSKVLYFPPCAIRNGEPHQVHTHVVLRRDAAAYRSVRFAPTIFQEYVLKAIELWITVVGSRVFAAAIDSQAKSCDAR